MDKGIWKHWEKLRPQIDDQYRLTINEGDTPIQNINLETGLSLYLKREDLNPTGSHKDRGLAYQLSANIQDGKKEFVISSSGNSSISAISLLKGSNIKLTISLSDNISEQKLRRIKHALGIETQDLRKEENNLIDNFEIIFSKRALSDAFKIAKSSGATLLRGSTDPYALQGFKTIAYELYHQLESIDAIFIPTSSGTTLSGIYLGLIDLTHSNLRGSSLTHQIPQLHTIQTTKVHPIAKNFDTQFDPTSKSLCDSIVDRVAHRLNSVSSQVKESNGSGWVISDKEILAAQHILRQNQIEASAESALSIAGALKAYNQGVIRKDQNIVCLLTGTI